MIGITGVATSGKDTLFFLLKEFFKKKNIEVERFALADSLKADLAEIIQKEFNIDIYNVSPKDKEIIRPILVEYGKNKRNQTQGRYWIEKLKKSEKFINNKNVPIITDIRYQEYERDELFWLKKEANGVLIHISRILKGKEVGPANADEEKNDIFLKKNSDYSFVWCSEKNMHTLYLNHIENLEHIYNIWKTRT